MEKIKACAFCKGVEQSYMADWKSVQCICGAFGPSAKDEAEAIQCWNVAANEIEKLRQERDALQVGLACANRVSGLTIDILLYQIEVLISAIEEK